MKVRNHTVIFILIALMSFHSMQAQETSLSAGVSQLNITPRVGYPHYRDFATAIDDSLYVKAVVFRQGEKKWALAVCDLLWIERSLSADVRVSVSEKTGIPFENILLTATHTHTGPAYHSNIYELNNHNRKYPGKVEEAIDKDQYPAFLKNRITESLIQAHERAVPVVLKSGKDTLENLSFNRRFIMKDGKVRTNPGKGNRDIVKTAGPVDRDLDIMLIENAADHSVMGVITSFAVHSDTYGGTAFSADYPGVLAKHLSEKFGKTTVSFFLMGASGDLNHIDIRKNGVVLNTSLIGRRLADKVIKKQPELVPVKNPGLDAASEFVYAPLQAYNEGEIRWAKSVDAPSRYGETGLFKLRRPMKILSLERIREEEGIPPTIETEPFIIPVEVQVFRLSPDIAVVGLPGEIFSELGLAIKKRSPFKTTLVVELTNVHIAYVPTRKAFSQGSYETLNSRLAPGGGELMVESAVRQLEELKK